MVKKLNSSKSLIVIGVLKNRLVHYAHYYLAKCLFDNVIVLIGMPPLIEPEVPGSGH
jgi:hypothetical protein